MYEKPPFVTPAERTKQLIDASPQEPLSIRHLAEVAHLSTFHLIREFRRHYFVTPHQYLIRASVGRARALLGETDMSVTEICFEVGFESLGSFSHLFKKATGWPPSVYRARSRERLREPRRFIPHCFWVMHHLGSDEPARSSKTLSAN